MCEFGVWQPQPRPKIWLWVTKSSLGPPASTTTPPRSQPISQKAPCGWGLGVRRVPALYILWLFLKNKKLKTKHYPMGLMRARVGFSPFELQHLLPTPPLPVSLLSSFPTCQLLGRAEKEDEMKLIPFKCFWIFFSF